MKAPISPADAAEKLRTLALQVRRIGDGYRTDPETIAIQKDEVAKELATLARVVGACKPACNFDPLIGEIGVEF